MMHENYTTSLDENGLSFKKPEPPKPFVPFPVDQLPEPLRSLVVEGAVALQCDPVLIVLPVLSTIGSAIGNSRQLMLKDGWSVSSSLWTMFIAESGSVKTPAFRLAKEPLEAIEESANDQFDADDERYESELAEYQAAKKQHAKHKEGDAPRVPTAPVPERFIVKDTTLAALVEILRDNPRGLLVAVDELAGWFGSFNKHDNGGGDAQHWLSIYSGESISVDRKGERNSRNIMRPIKVYRPFVSITGAIQPGLWRTTLGPEHQASGMAARFMMAMPPRRGKVWSDAEVSQTTRSRYAALVQSLVTLDADVTETGRYKPKFIGMGRAAKKRFQEFFDRHNVDHLNRNDALAAASSKIEEIPARLALLIHCVRFSNGDTAKNQVDAESMAAAIVMADWFMNEAERIYGAMDGDAASQPLRDLADWIRLRGGTVRASDLVSGRRQIKTVQQAETMLNRLVEFDWGAWRSVPSTKSGGRPTREFVLSVVSETLPNTEETGGFGYADAGNLGFVDVVDAFKAIEETTPMEDVDQVDPPQPASDDEVEVVF